MNLRKFYFITSIVVTAFLFISGIGILAYISSAEIDGSISTSTDNSVNDIFKPFVNTVSTKEPFNVLVLGPDKASNNTDTMILVNFNPETYKINIMSIPRDTKVRIGKNDHKINFAYNSGGVKLAVKTVSELMDINIKYYVVVDTAAFREIIDLLGGVIINVPADMDYDDPTQNLHIHLKKGIQTLNGKQAEQFIRFRQPNQWNKEIRKYYDGSDLKRIQQQQYFIKELIKQKLNIQYISKLDDIIETLFKYVETNFTLSEVLKLSGLASKISIDNVNFIQMPGTTLDASPWYYLCDVAKVREIAATEFRCKDAFVEADKSLKDSYSRENYNNIKSNGTKTTTNDKPKATPVPTVDVTKDNPSNSESSLDGPKTPEP